MTFLVKSIADVRVTDCLHITQEIANLSAFEETRWGQLRLHYTDFVDFITFAFVKRNQLAHRFDTEIALHYFYQTGNTSAWHETSIKQKAL